jgi:hypothetical protein
MVTLHLFCERRERVLVFVHNLIGYFHGLLEVGIVGHRLKSTASEFGNVQFLTSLEVEALHQFAGKQKTVGISDLFDLDFHREIVLLVRHIAAKVVQRTKPHHQHPGTPYGMLYDCITYHTTPVQQMFYAAFGRPGPLAPSQPTIFPCASRALGAILGFADVKEAMAGTGRLGWKPGLRQLIGSAKGLRRLGAFS